LVPFCPDWHEAFRPKFANSVRIGVMDPLGMSWVPGRLSRPLGVLHLFVSFGRLSFQLEYVTHRAAVSQESDDVQVISSSVDIALGGGCLEASHTNKNIK
jgi:hypothetical protein